MSKLSWVEILKLHLEANDSRVEILEANNSSEANFYRIDTSMDTIPELLEEIDLIFAETEEEIGEAELKIYLGRGGLLQ